MRWLRSLFAFLALALPCAAAAQDADVLTGRVTGTDGKPLIGARVEVVSVETEISRSVITDSNGRYMIVFPDGGGRYVLRVTYIGMADAVHAVIRGEEELLLTNVAMSAQAIELEGITVRGQRPEPGRGQAGEQTTDLPQDLLNRLPLPDLDPSTLALLSAGVIGTGLDSLSGRMGFSVAGMSELLNQITLDGVILGEGGLGVPEEGVRRTQVTTSTFDASRGGFAGGQVSMTTARGNNRNAGSLSYRLDNDALQLQASATTNAYTRHNLGGSWGGPLLRNKLFYNASFQFTRNVNHRFSLAADDPLAAQRSGVSVDSIGRFLNILDGTYGFPTAGQTGPYNQFNDDVRMQGRMDWNIKQDRTQGQTLSARFNLSLNNQDSTRINTFDLAQHGGDSERNNRLGALTMTSRFGTNWTNGLSLSYSENWSDAVPFTELPEGQVRVTSDFDDGTRGTRSLVFGGNRSLPTEAYSRDLQLSDDLSFLLPVGNQLHRLKVGGSVQKSRNVNRSTDNLFGTFTYNSLEDFENNLPDRYERSLTERESRTGTINTGLYVGDTWRVSQPLEFTLGLRWDFSKFDQRAGYNPDIESAFGRRTDVVPQGSGFSPRAGFNYRLNKQGQPQKSLSGGVGLFAGRPPTNIFTAALRQTGLPDAEQRLICIGEAVPFPDWDLYVTNINAVPTSCADGGPGVPDALSSRAPQVTLIDPDQSLPSSLRFDIGYRTQLPLRIQGNFRYSYSRGFGLWGYRDLNLDVSNSFALGNDGRPFYGDPSAIVDRTGAVSMTASRLHDEFGNVYDVTSSRESSAHQMTLQASGLLPKRITMNVNYTLGFARDQGSGSFAQSTTASNPNLVEWATSSNDRRHNVNLTLAVPVSQVVEISATTRLSSGTAFTPMVNRDINGDGVRNDRAFIFDPSATGDTAIAASMLRLLDNVPGRVKDCLDSQTGTIAGRNTCRDSWTESFDMRASIRPNLPSVGRRLTMSIDARNVLTGLDQVVNGRNGMKGWGEGQRADANLLEVTGFDPMTNSFQYQVNEGFGQARRGPNGFRNPFSLTISARLAIGGQPGQNNRGFGTLAGFGGFGGGGRGGDGGFGGGAGGLGELGALFRGQDGAINADSILAAALPNPLVSLIALKDSVGITTDQIAALRTISDSLQSQLDRRRSTLEPKIQGLIPAQGAQGGAPRGRGQQVMQELQLEIQPQLDGARRETSEAVRLAQRELTPEQWQKVPAAIRNAGQNAGGGRGGRGGFNAVGLIDRMLVNPIPVLLELKDTLKITPEQVTRIDSVSAALQAKLNTRREALGKRFDNVDQQRQGQIFQEIQPEMDAARKEVSDAMKAIQKILTSDQWKQVPERIKDPFQNQGGPGGGRGGRRGGEGF